MKPALVLLLSTWLALGSASEARDSRIRLQRPWTVVVLDDGRLLVRDAACDRHILCQPDGRPLRLVGPRVPALLGAFDMTRGPGGRLYTLHWGDEADPRPGVLVQDSTLNVVRDIRLAAGSAIGELMRPMGVAVGKDGRLFVADTGNDRVQVFEPDGSNPVVIGIGELRQPMKVALDSGGRLFVADSGRNRVAVYTQDREGVYRNQASLTEQMKEPLYVLVDSRDRLWVSTNRNSGIYVFAPDSGLITVWRGEGRRRVATPRGLAAASEGRAAVVHESDRSLWFARLASENTERTSREERHPIACEPWSIR